MSKNLSTQKQWKKESQGKKVVFRRNGILLTTDTDNPKALRLLENLLTYTYQEYLTPYEARKQGRKTVPVDVECYAYIKDEHDILPTRFGTTAGYIPLIRSVLSKNGFEPKFINVSPPTKPGIFKPDWSRIEGVKLRWKQDYVIETILRHDYARVDCPTGYGKSYLIAAICRLLPKARIHVTTHSKDVTEDLYFNIRKIVADTGCWTGATKRNVNARVMIVSGKSLHHMQGNADILIVDEVHEFGTEDYLERVKTYSFARMYGFSGSHDARHDNGDFALHGFFGPIRVRVTYQEAVNHGCVVPIRVHWRNVVSDINPAAGIDHATEKARRAIWTNLYRNEQVAKAAREFSDDTQVLIVVDKIEHAVNLKALLPEFTLCYSEDGMMDSDRKSYIRQGLLPSDEPYMTSKRRSYLKRQFASGKLKKVIATGVWNRGVDFRNLQVLIRADAKASKIADVQIPGRVARLGIDDHNKDFGVVIDFMDQFDSSYRRRAQKRKASYEEMEWQQIFPKTQASRVRAGQDKRQKNLFQ